MSIFEVGRICVKLAGRDAGRKCVIVEELDNLYVLVDGDVRRKKVNINHLEPIEEMLDIKEKAIKVADIDIRNYAKYILRKNRLRNLHQGFASRSEMALRVSPPSSDSFDLRL